MSRTARPEDLDLLGYGGNSIAEMELVFREICAVECAADGLVLPPESVQGGVIREDRKYEGVRINLLAMLGKARIPLQIDVGFGYAVVPPPTETEYPTLLELPAPRLRVYRRETVVAEKFHAMAERGIGNSRMKDYFDLWVLAGSFEFDGAILAEAIRAAFERRRTPLSVTVPVGLGEAFGGHPEKLARVAGLRASRQTQNRRGEPARSGRAGSWLSDAPGGDPRRRSSAEREMAAGRRSMEVTKEVYVSTDVETDGPIPGVNSMLSFGSAVYLADKTLISAFTANLETPPGAQGDPKTMRLTPYSVPDAGSSSKNSHP